MHGMRYRSFEALLGIRYPRSRMVIVPCISDSSSTQSYMALPVDQIAVRIGQRSCSGLSMACLLIGIRVAASNRREYILQAIA